MPKEFTNSPRTFLSEYTLNLNKAAVMNIRKPIIKILYNDVWWKNGPKMTNLINGPNTKRRNSRRNHRKSLRLKGVSFQVIHSKGINGWERFCAVLLGILRNLPEYFRSRDISQCYRIPAASKSICYIGRRNPFLKFLGRILDWLSNQLAALPVSCP